MAATNLGNVAVVPRGAWSASVAYPKNSLVGKSGNMYLALQDTPAGTLVTNTTYYMLSASKGADGDVTAAAMNAAIAAATDELQGQIDSLDTALTAANAAIIPIPRGGFGGTTAAQARTNLGITPSNIGAAPTVHTHSASGITSGVFTLPQGGTGVTTAAGIRNVIGLGNTSTDALGIPYGGSGQTSASAALTAYGIRRGTFWTNGVNANAYKDFPITFSSELPSVPIITASILCATGANVNYAYLQVATHSATTTGFTVRVFNQNENSLSPGVNWMAIIL